MRAALIDALRRRGTSTATTPSDRRIVSLRIASLAVVLGFLVFWLTRTGSLSVAAVALLAGCVLVSKIYGDLFVGLTSRLGEWHPGIAYELLVGFFLCNTLLFALTLASPLGMGGNVAVIAVVGILGAFTGFARRGRLVAPRARFDSEVCSLACIVFVCLAATLWVQDQQPLTSVRGGTTVFTVWYDVFIHAREISAFAQSHGLSSISDIKLSGAPAPIYHFASYMMPAALNALTPTSAMDAYAAFQLPFGLLMMGLAAYALPAMVLRTTWPAVLACAMLVASPDAYQQGFGIRYLSFHFMSQVNLGMLYGVACISLAWVFMIGACRRTRWEGLLMAYAFLATCATYKAHLFVANALLLMLYPCFFFGAFRWRWRLIGALGVVTLFSTVVALSQQIQRMPTLHPDLSGARAYIDILMGSFHDGAPRRLFESAYFGHRLPRLANAVLAGTLVLFGSFGWWVFVGPIATWTVRRRIEPRVIGFVALVVANYLVMSLFLALDRRGVGAPEEFLNRPHAWAWFVVVVFVTAMVAVHASGEWPRPSRRVSALMAAIGVVLLVFVQTKAQRLETFPEWEAHGDFADFNAVPTCQVRAARYVRDNARHDDLLQDSQFDPGFVVTAIAERQAYVVNASFGGSVAEVAERVASLKDVQSRADEGAFRAWADANRVRWYLLHPEEAGRWPTAFLRQAVFACDGWRLFRLN